MDLDLNANVSLVVAERGARWLAWSDRFQAATPEVVLVLQEEGESAESLAARVRDRMSELASNELEVSRAVIIGSGRGTGSLSARNSAIKAIVAPMVELGRGTLILDGPGRDRFSMAALADTVGTMVKGSGVKVVATSDSVAAVA